MQDYSHSRAGPLAAPYATQMKVAIPRLPARHPPPPPTPKSRHRDRVQRACRNCHKRKIKCSGGLPRCNYCEKTERPCVYELPRGDRLATAKDKNQHLASLLKDLSKRVSDHDKRIIDDALQHSDDEAESPASVSSSRASASHPYPSQSRFRSLASSSSNIPPLTEPSPTSDRSSLPRLDGIDPDAESGPDDDTTSPHLSDAVFPSQISDIQWLQSLRHRVQAADAVYVGPSHASSPATNLASETFDACRPSIPPGTLQQVAPVSYHLDDDGIKLADCGNPFELPPEHTATLLFQSYLMTVQSSFPLLPTTLVDQLHQYYRLVQSGTSIHCPEKWFALVNLVFAIGAKYSHLTMAEWQASDMDHIIYMSRAHQLLSMNDTVLVLSTPDLFTVQAAGLFSFYYMIIGHVNRAWVMTGTALRSAISLGLHMQDLTLSLGSIRRQSMIRTWWSLHALESLLSSITGRPSMIPNDDLATPLPNTIMDNLPQENQASATNLLFLDANTTFNRLNQQVISSMYIQRRSSPSWDQIQQTITTLMSELDKWAEEHIPEIQSGSETSEHSQRRECLLLKFQYYRLKVLVTRPSLHRIEQCAETGTEDFTSFDLSVAKTCIQAAQDIAGLLANEPDVTSLYTNGPWWSVVHNIMQAVAILMNAIACAEHFADSLDGSIQCVRHLVSWLQALRETNTIADRAYQVLYSIVKMSKPRVWNGIVDVFPDEVSMVLQLPASSIDEPSYLPWPNQDFSSDTLFQHEIDSFGNYHLHFL